MMQTKHLISFGFSLLLCGIICANANEFSDSSFGAGTTKVSQTVNTADLEKTADKYFYTGMESDDINKREAYLSRALEKYMLLLKLKPNDVTTCTQIAVIHDNLNHPRIAKTYFIRAVNLEKLNPFANFYYGEYYFAKREYQKALIYYLTAYNNGYRDSFPVNLRLATVYEKLGDLAKARIYYIAAEKQNPAQNGIRAKIESLEKIYYSKSDYQHN